MLVFCLTLIISGGLGNIIDRLFRGGRVVDYLDLQLFDFAIFNLCGLLRNNRRALLLIYILFFDKSGKKSQNEIKADNNE